MIPDKKTVLFVLGLAAAITLVAHLLLTSAKEKKQRGAYDAARTMLDARGKAVAPLLRKMLAEKPKLLAELSKLGPASADAKNEFAFLHPQTSEIVVFRTPKNETDPGRVASKIAALPSPLMTAYDPTNGLESHGMILLVLPLKEPK